MHKNTFTYLHKNFSPTLHSHNFTVKSFKSQKACKKKYTKTIQKLINLNTYPHKQTNYVQLL